MIIKPGEIHMNEDELKHGMDRSCITDNEDKV
jgi:hypothetical protein